MKNNNGKEIYGRFIVKHLKHINSNNSKRRVYEDIRFPSPIRYIVQDNKNVLLLVHYKSISDLIKKYKKIWFIKKGKQKKGFYTFFPDRAKCKVKDIFDKKIIERLNNNEEDIMEVITEFRKIQIEEMGNG